MSSLQLDPKQTALVVIDLQKGIVAMAAAVPHSAADVVERSARLAKHLREKGGTVVYVHVDMANMLNLPVDAPMRPPNSPPPPASAMELVPEAGFQDGDVLITKRHWGAFAGTELEQILKKRGVDTIVLTGISTNIGVESTARQGTGLGFGFVIVEDACAARDAGDHRYSFEKIFPRLARVRKTDEVIAALGGV
ncbi:MAG TPA: hydrolase [Terriglobales bacterium]|jgi:nicotinamidase-related amidase